MSKKPVITIALLFLARIACAQAQLTTVLGFGNNDCGQLDAPANLTNAIRIAAGKNHTLALKSDGTVVAWGGVNRFGRATGWRGHEDGASIPQGLTNVVAISAGLDFSLALKADGTMMAWGDHHYGQTNLPPGLTNLAAISAGSWHCLVLKTDGTLAAWGYRDEGNEEGRSIVPMEITDGVAIASGAAHNLVLRKDGTVAGWGRREWRAGVVPQYLFGVQAVAAGTCLSLALKRDGTVVGWGFNRTGAATGTPSPDQYPWTGSGTVTIRGARLRRVIAIAAGKEYSLALKRDGTVVSWGNAPSFGRLSNIVAIAAAEDHFLVLQRRNLTPHR